MAAGATLATMDSMDSVPNSTGRARGSQQSGNQPSSGSYRRILVILGAQVLEIGDITCRLEVNRMLVQRLGG